MTKSSHKRQEALQQFIKRLGLSTASCPDASRALNLLDEALTHTSTGRHINHERLEFLGDAVLRLAASEYIEQHHAQLPVGERSALRAQLVSDRWLAALGAEINIDAVQTIGAKAKGDDAGRATLRAEATEALIGALYQGWSSLEPVQCLLTPHWHVTAQAVLATPHKFNGKTTLQEWSQGQGLGLPCHRRMQPPAATGRFRCRVSIQDQNLAEAKGRSRKEAEQNAAAAASGPQGSDAPQHRSEGHPCSAANTRASSTNLR